MDRPPKKSETLEIRLPHETKLAFMARCREDGVSASEALRALIGARIEAPPAPAPAPEPASGPSPSPWRKRLQHAAGAAVALGVAATAVPSLAGSVDRRGFAQLDADADGALTSAELSRGAVLRLELGASGIELGRSEIRPGGPSLPPADRALFERVLQARFTALDADADGRITFPEFRSR